MNKAELHAEINLLISKDELPRAAELLARYWQGKHTALHQAVLAQIRRINTLEEQQIKGLLSAEAANLEHAGITDALLTLTSQITADKPNLPESLTDKGKPDWRWLKWLAPLGIILTFTIIWVTSEKNASSPFNLTVNAQAYEDESPISEGRIKIIIGGYHLPAKDLDRDGQVIFSDIPAQYWADSIEVVPVDLKYTLKDRMFPFPVKSRHLTVSLIPRPDTTIWSGIVMDSQKRGIAGAKIDIEKGTALAVSGPEGHFKIPVPLPSHQTVRVMVSLHGNVALDRSFTISEEVPASIVINNTE